MKNKNIAKLIAAAIAAAPEPQRNELAQAIEDFAARETILEILNFSLQTRAVRRRETRSS